MADEGTGEDFARMAAELRGQRAEEPEPDAEGEEAQPSEVDDDDNPNAGELAALRAVERHRDLVELIHPPDEAA